MEDFAIRPATLEDRAVIGHHRAAMFVEMGKLAPSLAPILIEATSRFLETAIPEGTYVGWLLTPRTDPQVVLAGAGVQIRALMPRPHQHGDALLSGRQALIVNVFVERVARRRGLARSLMAHVLAWTRDEGITSVVLHASDAGRRLYEDLGFIATNEMQYSAAERRNG
jgi:GNAT superfamily N-acetyltransferase